jgi:hypothetical protein
LCLHLLYSVCDSLDRKPIGNDRGQFSVVRDFSVDFDAFVAHTAPPTAIGQRDSLLEQFERSEAVPGAPTEATLLQYLRIGAVLILGQHLRIGLARRWD